MSWSVSGVGRASALRDKVAKQFDGINCAEPEQTIKNKVAAIVDISLQAMRGDQAVKVSCSGSQYVDGQGQINTVRVEVEPIYGFVE